MRKNIKYLAISVIDSNFGYHSTNNHESQHQNLIIQMTKRLHNVLFPIPIENKILLLKIKKKCQYCYKKKLKATDNFL